MLVTLGMMAACYFVTQLLLVPLLVPGSTPPSRAHRFTITVVVFLGILGVGYCASTLIGQGTPRETRAQIEVDPARVRVRPNGE